MNSHSAVYDWITAPIRSLSTDEPSQGGLSFGRRLLGVEVSSRVVMMVVGIALCVHGYEVFASHLTIDEELFIDREAWTPWISQGRWGMGLLNYGVLSRPIGPVVSTVIGLLGFLVALLITLKGQTRSEVTLVLSTAVGVAAPTLPFLLSFTTLSFGAGLAAVAGALAARAALLMGGPAGLGVSLALIVVAVGIYEPFLFVFPTVAVLWLTRNAVARGLHFGAVAQCVVRVAVLSGVGVGISRLITRGAQAVTDVAPSPYVGSLLDMGGLLETPVARVRAGIDETLIVLSGSESVYGADLSILGVVLGGSFLLITASVLLTQWRRGAVMSLLLLAATAALPFVAESLTADIVPLRSQVYIPFLLAGIVAITLEATASWRGGPLRLLPPAAAGLLVLALMSYANRLYLSTEIAFDRDSYVAFEVDREMSELTGEDPDSAQELVVVGALYRKGLPTPAAEIMGASFLEWDGGSAVRMSRVLWYVTGRSIQPAEPPRSLELAERTDDMPNWPLEGSVRMIDGTTVVKFGEPTSTQLSIWCQVSTSTLCSTAQ